MKILPKLTRIYVRLIFRMIPLAPEVKYIIQELKESRFELDVKIAQAHKSLLETVELIHDLEDALKESTNNLNLLRQEYDRYSELAGIEEEKAKIVLGEVSKTLGKGKGRERLERLIISLIAGLIVFVLGIVLGPTIRVWLGMS